MRIAMVDLDALAPAGLEAARLLCSSGRANELFERALGDSAECRGRAAVEANGTVAGLALHGMVAGALGTGALLWVAVRAESRRRGIGRALVSDALGELLRGGARLAVAELSSDAAIAPMVALLLGAGFEREGTIPDFYRDGIDLILCRRPLR